MNGLKRPSNVPLWLGLRASSSMVAAQPAEREGRLTTPAESAPAKAQVAVLSSMSGTSARILIVEGVSSRSERQFSHARCGVAR